MTFEAPSAQPSPFISVWRRPRETIARVVATEPRRYVLIITALAALGSLVTEMLTSGLGGYLLDWRIAVGAVIVSIAVGILLLYAGGYIFRVCAKPFGGCAPEPDVRTALAWSQLPYLALAVFSLLALAVGKLFLGASSSTVGDILSVVGWIVAVWALSWLGLMLARVQGFGFWRGTGSMALGLLALTLVMVLIALAFRAALFQPFSIPSASMMPTLQVGDTMFVSKYAYGYSRFSLPFRPSSITGRILTRAAQRGDVVVFALPNDDRIDYVKRIVGLPGERVQMIAGLLHINGTPVPRESLGEVVLDSGGTAKRFRETLPNGVTHETLEISDTGFLDNTMEFLVPDGHYFMLGDNRDNSSDSRVSQVGFVPQENLIGRAGMIFFSKSEDGEDPFRRVGAIR